MPEPIPIFLISLPQDSARREEIDRQFPRYYPQMNVIDAVMGKELTAGEYYQHLVKSRTAEKGRPMTPGEVGCALSHIKACKALLETDAEYGLILEDDVIGDDNRIEQVFGLINLLPRDVLLLCGGQNGLDIRKYQLGKVVNKETGLYEVAGFSQQYTTRACCYVVSRSFAQTVIREQSEFLRLADDWTWFLNKGDASMYYVNLFDHPEDLGSSHLEKERAEHRADSFWKKLFSLRGPERVLRKLYQFFSVKKLSSQGYERLP